MGYSKYLITVVWALVVLLFLKGQSTTAQPNWDPPVNLEFSMQVVAKLLLDFDEFSEDPDDLVGAFIDGSLSGVAERDPSLPDYLFLTIHASSFNGQTITFQAYLADLDLIVPITQTIPFVHATAIGTLDSPFIFSFDNTDRTIIATAGDNGNISPSGAVNVNYGQNQTFTITPDFGYEVEDVLVDGESVGAVSAYTFEQVIEDHSILATFAPATYWIAYIKWGEGSFIGNTWQYVEHGEDGTPVEIVPAEGYYFEGWDDGVMDNPRQETHVTEDMIIMVTLGIHTYSLNYSAGTNGSLIGDASQTVQHGGNGSPVEVVPDENYLFSHWSDQNTDNPRTDINVTNNIHVGAIYTPVDFTIEASSGSNGSINPSGSILTPYGSNYTFEMEPADGYMVVDVMVDDESVGAMDSYTFTNIDQDHSIHVEFELQHYTLTYLSDPEGMIEGETVQSVPHGGAGTIVTAVPIPSHHFDSWSDGSTMNPRLDVNITSDLTVTAQYALNTHTITASAAENGSINPEGAVEVDEGASQGFTIMPDVGYQIHDVLIDGASIGPINSYEFVNVTSDHSIHAIFQIKSYTLTYLSDANGSLSGDTVQVVNHGSDGTPVEAIPDPGYIFVGWSDGVNSNPRTDLDVTGNLTVMAAFSSDGPPAWEPPENLEYNMQMIGLLLLADSSFSLDVNDLVGAFVDGECRGVGSPAPDLDGLVFLTIGADQHTGEEISFKAYIDEQNLIVNLNESISFVSMSEIGTLLDPFVFSYTEITYTITAAAEENGSIAPEGDIVVPHWGNQGFSILADTGYHIADVFIDGESIGAVDTFTFINVFQNRSILASFEINTYFIEATAGENGSIFPSDTVPITHGRDTTFTFQPDEGYVIYNVWVNGDSIGAVEAYTFTHVSDDQSIHVDFDLATSIQTGHVNDQKVLVYPNPARDQLSIQIPEQLYGSPVEAMLYDYAGNLVRSVRLTANPGQFDLKALPAGLYFLRLQTGKLHIGLYKINKMH